MAVGAGMGVTARDETVGFERCSCACKVSIESFKEDLYRHLTPLSPLSTPLMSYCHIVTPRHPSPSLSLPPPPPLPALSGTPMCT